MPRRFLDLFPVCHFRLFMAAVLIIAASVLSSSCGGGGGDNALLVLPEDDNVGGGYTLLVSGGTLQDNSGATGFVVLATLRDSAGNGPAMPWSLSITGPGFGAPLTVSYDDGSPSSYMP